MNKSLNARNQSVFYPQTRSLVASVSRLSIILGLFWVSGCATHTVKSTSYTPAIQAIESVPENLLMDVGVAVFDPGIDELSRSQEEIVNQDIRIAESQYVPFLLAETLQRTGNWGIVRVMPNTSSPMDLYLSGTILNSDGESMAVRVRVEDSTGEVWYTKEYNEATSRFSYEPSQKRQNDPFQTIYNSIANDLLAFKEKKIKIADVEEIRAISELRFAKSFIPEAFEDYIDVDRNGEFVLVALPSEQDPLLGRLRTIRERDFMFIDTVQDYYDTYARQMREPYDSWREQSFYETLELRELEASARRRILAGGVAVLGGLAAATSGGDYVTQTGGAFGAGAGAYMIKSGFDKRAEAQMHRESLRELGESLENDVAPRVIDLQDRTITLSGTVEEQYEQWREILADLYAYESGDL
ncbi:MAG: hypothetical protein CMQ02_04785 [Gammaproteobacteria bacterium]|nr:hypothetical protein [Gammaproteobacteria bacterium]